MRNKWVAFLTTAFLTTGGLMIALAYLMIRRPLFIVEMAKYAVVIGLAFFGIALLYTCFSVMIRLRRKS